LTARILPSLGTVTLVCNHANLGSLVFVVSISHTITHIHTHTKTHILTHTHTNTHAVGTYERVISPSQRPLPTRTKQTQEMLSTLFEPVIPATERPQTYA